MAISRITLQRLPMYLNFLRRLPPDVHTISATVIASQLDLGDVQVRKDLAGICGGGKPRTGYQVDTLIRSLEAELGYNARNRAILVGAGKLGSALLNYQGFADYGLDILAAFDIDPAKCGTSAGKPVLPLEQLEAFCRTEHVQLGIITVPAEQAQEVCDRMGLSGIRAIWNFAPIHLSASSDILIQNENMAASLALLSSHLKETSPH